MTVFNITLSNFVGKDVTFKEVIEQAGLDFEVAKCPVKAIRPIQWGEVKMDHLSAVYRTDNGEVVSHRGVGTKYEIVQIRDALSFVENLVSQEYANYGYAGAPGGGSKAYIVLRAAGSVKVSDKDSIENWFTVTTAHDGSARIEVMVTPIFSLNGSVLTPTQERHLSFKHTKNVKTRLKQALTTIKRVTSEWEMTELQLQKMMNVKISKEEAEKYFTDVIGSKDIENSQRALNIREEMMSTFQSGAYNLIPNMSGTMFGAYSSAVEWCDLKKPLRKSKVKVDEREARLYSRITGSAAKQKARAHGFALKMCQFADDDAYGDAYGG